MHLYIKKATFMHLFKTKKNKLWVDMGSHAPSGLGKTPVDIGPHALRFSSVLSGEWNSLKLAQYILFVLMNSLESFGLF